MVARPWRPRAEERRRVSPRVLGAPAIFFAMAEPNAETFTSAIGSISAMSGWRWSTATPSRGDALLIAIVAHADIPFDPPARLAGQPLEVGAQRNAGRPCSNAWRKVLAGECRAAQAGCRRGNWRVKPRRLGSGGSTRRGRCIRTKAMGANGDEDRARPLRERFADAGRRGDLLSRPAGRSGLAASRRGRRAALSK